MSIRQTPWPDGYPCWVDLGSSDRLGAWDYYTAVLGWQIRDTGPEMGHYGLGSIDGHSVGAIGQAMPGMPSGWTVYFATSDVDKTAAAVTGAGGSLLMPPGDVGPAGRMAIAADPTGAVFALWQAGVNPGFRVTGEPGAPSWFDLQTRDLPAAQAFYTAVFGWQHLAMGDGSDYSTVPGDMPGGMICGLGAIGADVPADVPAHWRVYFAVGDADGAASTTAAQGGSVVMEPSDTPYGRMSILTDPQGASFVVLGPVSTAQPSEGENS